MILYLYGFTPLEQEPPPDSLRGIAGAEVALERLDSLNAVVSRVPASDFSVEAVEERMHDLTWLGEQGARHERVVTWFVDHGEILPARLLTLYSGPEALREEVAPRIDVLAGQLARLSGRREWDLKMTYDPQVLAQHLGEVSERVGAMDREMEAAAPGRRYLMERKREKLVRQETSRTARTLAQELFAALEAHAEDARTLPLQRVGDEEGAGGLVLNGALLFDAAGAERALARFEEERTRLEALGLEPELTGPWAPYRFLEAASPEDAP